MIFAVLFDDDQAFASMREKYMTQHLAFLEKHSTIIQSAGPLTSADTGSNAGGLWLVSAEDVDDVHTLIREDPFWPTGLRKSVEVFAWNRVFADGKRLR